MRRWSGLLLLDRMELHMSAKTLFTSCLAVAMVGASGPASAAEPVVTGDLPISVGPPEGQLNNYGSSGECRDQGRVILGNGRCHAAGRGGAVDSLPRKRGCA